MRKAFIHFWDAYYTTPRAPSPDIVSEYLSALLDISLRSFSFVWNQKNVKDKTTTQKLFSWVTTLYPRMLPFCSCSGTGPQVTRMRLELMASAVTFSGAPDGTTQTEKDKSHPLIALCLNTRPRVLSKLTWISHLSNVIREKRQQTALACEQQTRLWGWGDSEQTNKRR